MIVPIMTYERSTLVNQTVGGLIDAGDVINKLARLRITLAADFIRVRIKEGTNWRSRSATCSLARLIFKVTCLSRSAVDMIVT